MWVWSLGQEDPLEEGMATHSRILAWRIPWTEEPGGLPSTGSQRVVGHDLVTKQQERLQLESLSYRELWGVKDGDACQDPVKHPAAPHSREGSRLGVNRNRVGKLSKDILPEKNEAVYNQQPTRAAAGDYVWWPREGNLGGWQKSPLPLSCPHGQLIQKGHHVSYRFQINGKVTILSSSWTSVFTQRVASKHRQQRDGNLGANCTPALSTDTCCPRLRGLSQVLLQPRTFNTPWREFSVDSRQEASMLREKLAGPGFQTVRYSEELLLWAQFLYLLPSRKALNSFMVMTIPPD